jgi:hypothetical protein
MREKNLTVKFHKGLVYEIPALIIAENRANYYAELDGYEKESQEWFDEVNRALEDEYEIFSWMQNSMEWKDLQPYALLVSNIENDINLDQEWNDGEHSIFI